LESNASFRDPKDVTHLFGNPPRLIVLIRESELVSLVLTVTLDDWLKLGVGQDWLPIAGPSLSAGCSSEASLILFLLPSVQHPLLSFLGGLRGIPVCSVRWDLA
jgi:hypothetical protein